MKILVTGDAGFIGYHAAKRLLELGHEVWGYDSVNDYYDPKLKEARLADLQKYSAYRPHRGLLEDQNYLEKVWQEFQPDRVLHLAAQAGVRYSLENPMAYIQANLVGFQNVIELVRQYEPQNFVYASSSSVYGGIKEYPFSEKMPVNQPISLYAATKASNELIAYSYAHLYGIPTTGLRFFTVYGPFARPDMAMFKFARLMWQGEKIPVFNQGNMVRDFTYVDDIVDGILLALDRPQQAKVYNFGRGEPMKLMDMVRLLEKELDLKADIEFLPMQAGDVPQTMADISLAQQELGYQPKVSLAEGVHRFAQWFHEYQNNEGILQ